MSFPVVRKAQAKADLQPLPDFDDSMLQGRTKIPRKSCQQQRLVRYLGAPDPEPSTEGLEVSG